MGTWKDVVSENIVEASAGAGARGTLRAIEPGEGGTFEVVRTDDANDSDPWLVGLEITVDDSNFGTDPPLRSFRLATGTGGRILIPFRGPFAGIHVFVINDDATPTDVIAATVKLELDGVTI